MMRSLWTASSGMSAQQLNVDTIANNLANVNTAGYKKERLEFKTLLYDTLERTTQDEGVDAGKPVNLQIGHGVRPIATSRIQTHGAPERTDNPLDFYIEGDGLFMVRQGEDIVYTRDGTLKISITDDVATLVTSQGYPVLDTDENNIEIPANINVKDLVVDQEGVIYYVNGDNETTPIDAQIGLVQFPNFQGLEAIGSNLYRETVASGAPLYEADEETNANSRIIQNFVEMSNVQVAEEMVKLIVAQRAYELNSKAITTSDDMLQTANNLKR